MQTDKHIIYLHGFASGPTSSKAKYFGTMFRQRGFEVHIPDLNGDSFADLTLTSQLKIIDDIALSLGDKRIVLMGSSMGGLLAALAASRYPTVQGLILMAPGFGLHKRWLERLGPLPLSEWQSRGAIEVFHHGFEKEMPLKYSFIEDAQTYDTEDIQVSVPSLVMHGIHDTVVPPVESERFAKTNPDLAQLHMLDSDHGLLNVLEEMNVLVNRFIDTHVVV
jgi:pimeloyl-ACP methyl ester carboxylesterase